MFAHPIKQIDGYFGKHAGFNALVHMLGGLGVGIIIATPVAYPHPVRWGLILLGLSFLGHLYAFKAKK